MKSVAFGPGDTHVVFGGEQQPTWSGGLTTSLWNMLNGRYPKRGQHNSPVHVLAYNSDSWFAGFKDGGWKCSADSGLSAALHKTCGRLDFGSFGDGSSYVFSCNGQMFWRGVPFRMEQLIQSRRQHAVEWAALGHQGAWFLRFSDGTVFWGGSLNEHIESTCANGPSPKRLFLSPSNDNYYVQFGDGRAEWVADTKFDNHMEMDRMMDPRPILYSNNSIKDTFSCGRSIHAVAGELRAGQIDADDIPAMSVVCVDGRWYSLDNRRLWAFSTAEVDEVPVIVKVANRGLVNKIRGFDGRSVDIRGHGGYGGNDSSDSDSSMW
jgi:hypothetical protein